MVEITREYHIHNTFKDLVSSLFHSYTIVCNFAFMHSCLLRWSIFISVQLKRCSSIMEIYFAVCIPFFIQNIYILSWKVEYNLSVLHIGEYSVCILFALWDSSITKSVTLLSVHKNGFFIHWGLLSIYKYFDWNRHNKVNNGYFNSIHAGILSITIQQMT